jgi:hypothetical protein
VPKNLKTMHAKFKTTMPKFQAMGADFKTTVPNFEFMHAEFRMKGYHHR